MHTQSQTAKQELLQVSLYSKYQPSIYTNNGFLMYLLGPCDYTWHIHKQQPNIQTITRRPFLELNKNPSFAEMNIHFVQLSCIFL